MIKPNKSKTQLVEEMTEAPMEVSIQDLPLETMRDFRLYNEKAREANKRLKFCKYKIKPCPVELHPTERVVFSRNDQPLNPLKVFVSDSMIHFEKELIPGKQYDLPKYIVNHLQERGTAVWGWHEKADGSRETRKVNKIPRFSLKMVYQGYE